MFVAYTWICIVFNTILNVRKELSKLQRYEDSICGNENVKYNNDDNYNYKKMLHFYFEKINIANMAEFSYCPFHMQIDDNKNESINSGDHDHDMIVRHSFNCQPNVFSFENIIRVMMFMIQEVVKLAAIAISKRYLNQALDIGTIILDFSTLLLSFALTYLTHKLTVGFLSHFMHLYRVLPSFTSFMHLFYGLLIDLNKTDLTIQFSKYRSIILEILKCQDSNKVADCLYYISCGDKFPPTPTKMEEMLDIVDKMMTSN